ncbi:MAG: hypothetical protein RBR55_03395, partial [Synergistaceae bacterium]|nr:hypothetical protein [Synergistaceae bacterium]
FHYSNNAEPQAADPLNHEEVAPLRHRPRIFHPLEDLFLNVAFHPWMTLHIKYPELSCIFCRIAPEAHRAPVDSSSPGYIYSHMDVEFVPVSCNFMQPVLRCNTDPFLQNAHLFRTVSFYPAAVLP